MVASQQERKQASQKKQVTFKVPHLVNSSTRLLKASQPSKQYHKLMIVQTLSLCGAFQVQTMTDPKKSLHSLTFSFRELFKAT